MSEFKKGDTVRCVSVGPNQRYLTLNKQYIVKEVAGYHAGILRVTDDCGALQGFFNHRFVKVEDTMKTVTLNGVEYKVENIPGKGECLVPYVEPVVTYKDVRNKILKDNLGNICICKMIDYNETYVVFPLNDMWSSGRYKGTDSIERKHTVVAENLSDAIKKGLVK
jgi:hypothetical protein